MNEQMKQKQFRKKPVVIEAVQWTGDNAGEIEVFMNGTARWHAIQGNPVINTLEGDHLASRGDWIIKGVKGEFYPCKPDVFALTYEPFLAARADAPGKEQPTNPIDAAFEGLADFYEQPAHADVVERMVRIIHSVSINKNCQAYADIVAALAVARDGWVPVSAYTALQKVLDLREAEIERNARNEVARIMDGVALIADPLVKKICDERDALKQQLATMEHDERMEEQTIKQRDDAEESLSQAYYLITGRSPEWSNLFGHAEALEEIDDAQQTLRKQLATMYTLDAIEKAMIYAHCTLSERHDMLARLTAKPKQERVTVRRSDADEPHLVTVWLDGKEECCNMRPLHAERYATGLRAEIAAAEQEDDHAR